MDDEFLSVSYQKTREQTAFWTSEESKSPTAQFSRHPIENSRVIL